MFIQVAVPAPCRIRVREMAQIFGCAIPVMSAGAGMGMNCGAVAGNGKVFLWHEPAFQGRQDGHMIKEALQTFLKVKRDVFSGHKPFFDHFSDLWFCFLCFLLFPFGLIGLFAVPGSGEQFISCI